MLPFILHTPETATESAAALFTEVTDQLGFLPNIFAVMGGAVPALASFVALNQQLANASLTPLERELVQTVTSTENRGAYCVAGHTAFVDMQGLDEDAIQAVRDGAPISDPKLQALRVFTERMVDTKGRLAKWELAEFLDAGYTADQVFEVILGIAAKFLSNLASNVSKLSLDEPFSPFEWTPSVANKRAA